ncbi:MAG: hypothetical protein PUE15_08060 [Prevotella sp.]|nr:hypothetical protein [Prevotella sp.]
MKKQYITPEIRVTELTENMTILAGSDTGNNGSYDNGGVEELDANETKPAKWGSVWD